MEQRTCTKCGESKPATPEFFSRHRQIDPNGLRPACKACQSKSGREYAERNREKINARAAEYREARREELARKQREYHWTNREEILAKMRAGALKHEYGLTPEQYMALLESQGYGCAICGREPKTKSLSVDHSHETGKVRGLLCHRCNRALGVFGDNEAGLLRAIEYLRGADERIAAALPDGPAFKPRARRYVYRDAS